MTDPAKNCFLCDNPADTKEHIIPQWLQKHFSLPNQKLGLWNDTALSYRQAVIPLCQICNGNYLSRLEHRIQSNTANDTDFYLWALKIRFLLSIKDTTLQFDRKDPTKGKLVSPEIGYIGQEYVRHALRNLETPGFFFRPNPFGSVFLFDNPITDSEFGFVDVPHPYWGLTISLPNNKILATLLTDRGMVKREIENDYKNKGGIKKYISELPAKTTNELIRLLMLKLLIKQYQIKNIPYGVSFADNAITSKPVPKSVNYRKSLKREVLVDISHTIGLDTKFAEELYNSLPDSYKG